MKYIFAVLLTLLSGCGGKDSDDSPRTPKTAETTDHQGPGIAIRQEAQTRAGIRVEQLSAHIVQPESIAYGKLEEDPSESFVLRAEFAGTLRKGSGQEWPSLGESIAAGSSFGRIEPRLQLTDQIALNTQLATARAELNASGAAVAAARTAYDRARALNDDNKNISDKALQEAATKLAAEQARQTGAQNLVLALNSSLASPGASATKPVVARRGGQVVEVSAQPDEWVEQGAPLVRLARFDRLLARIDLPVGEHTSRNSGAVRIVAAGFEDQAPLPAERVGVAAASDPHAQGVSLLYRLSRTLPELRPGMAVTAWFTLPGSKGMGVLIPQAAIVQQDGGLWAYVQTKDNWFSRRPVPTDLPARGGFIAARGFSPGDRIVVTGAQTLLSEEFKAQNEADTN